MADRLSQQDLAQAEPVALNGEGEVRYVRKVRCRHECAVCGEPADFRHSYLLAGDCRRNPASSAYGRDDCTFCSDGESFVCATHKSDRQAPNGMEWAGTYTLAKFPHMGMYWHEENCMPPVLSRLDALLLRMREEAYEPSYQDLLNVKGGA